MSPDDPRHGTVAGYNRIPCRDECCKLAMARYKKRWAWDKANGRERITSTLGTRRRIESLAWLGWSRVEIAKRAGMHATNMTRLLEADTMTVALAGRFAQVYEEMCMRLPSGNQQAIANVRNRARRRGAVPPLAWTDIDDPNDRPTGWRDDVPALPNRERTWDSPDHRACPRCGVVREVAHGRGLLCHDCRIAVA